jgi:hypothetical protein
MARTKSNTAAAQSSATIGFEAKLWLTADKLRNNMDAAEYKHVVLGLIFLKYISDTFEEHRRRLAVMNFVDCMVARLGQPLDSTQIPIRPWFNGKNEPAWKCRAAS